MKLTAKEILKVIFTSATVWCILIIWFIMLVSLIFNKDFTIIVWIFLGFMLGSMAMRFDKDRTIKVYDDMLQKSFEEFYKLYETTKKLEKKLEKEKKE